jgi:hypothetical protein
LLELAWNNGAPDQRFFEEARKLAGNESQIKNLIDSRFPDGHPDRGPIELYFCLFYYLNWYFGEGSEKDIALKQFDNHITLATGSGVSGQSDEILKRCKILAERISE